MKFKLIGIYFVIFGIFTAILIWRVDVLLFGSRISNYNNQMRSLIFAICHSIDSQIKTVTRELENLTLASQDENSKEKMKKKFLPGTHLFLRIGLNEQKKWSLLNKQASEKWMTLYNKTSSSNGNSKGNSNNAGGSIGNGSGNGNNTSNWAEVETLSLLNKLSENKDSFQKISSNNSVQIYPLSDPKKNTYFLFLTKLSKETAWQAIITEPSFFQKTIDLQKGQETSFLIVNSQGQALGYSLPEYLGKSFEKEPIVNELVKSGGASGAGLYKNLREENVFAQYEEVEGSNLYLVAQIPMTALLKEKNQIRFHFIFVSLGLFFIGLSFLFFFIKDKTSWTFPSLPKMPKTPITTKLLTPTSFSTVNYSSQKKIAPIPIKPIEDIAPQAYLDPLIIQKEKVDAYLKLASALTHELKGPSASLLVQSQIMRQSSLLESLKPNLNKIEEHARRIHTVVQNLLNYTGEEDLKLEITSLEKIVTNALKTVEGKILSKAIIIEKNIEAVPNFPIIPDLLKKSLENIFNNAIESMERKSKKKISIDIHQKGDLIELSVSDSGDGISKENLDKIFTPFFSTKKKDTHLGLGLSISLGGIREMNGTVSIDSVEGKGTKVLIQFNPKKIETLKISEESLSTPMFAPTSNPKSSLKPASTPASPPEPPSFVSKNQTRELGGANSPLEKELKENWDLDLDIELETEPEKETNTLIGEKLKLNFKSENIPAFLENSINNKTSSLNSLNVEMKMNQNLKLSDSNNSFENSSNSDPDNNAIEKTSLIKKPITTNQAPVQINRKESKLKKVSVYIRRPGEKDYESR